MQKCHKNRGFTVFELLVTMSVFALLSVSVISNFRASTEAVMMNTLANQIVTEVRHAQTYSLANVKQGIAVGFLPYGVYFNKSAPTSFILFKDLAPNDTYDAGLEHISTFTLKNQNTITKLCVNLSATGTCSEVTELNVTFTRPYPEPIITPVPDMGVPYASAEIIISSPSGRQKTIVVWITGQIAIVN